MSHPPLFRRVCLDMDGVLCDFYCGIASLLGREAHYRDYLAAPAKAETVDYEVFGLSKAEALLLVDSAGEEFWENLPAYPWVQELFAAARQSGETVSILTSCGRFRHAHIGKLRWLQKHGLITRDSDVILSHLKHLHAGPADILVDDNASYIANWTKAGGVPALLSRPWNGASGLSESEILDMLQTKPAK